MAKKRSCKATTKAGKPCKAAPLRDSDHCSAHDPTLPDGTRFGSPEQASRAGASEKPRVPKLREALIAKVEERAEDIVAALFDALDAERVVVVGSGESAEAELHPDHKSRLRAVTELFDRTEGKPRQVLEHSGNDGGPIQLEGDLADPAVRDALFAAAKAIDASRRDA